MALNVEGAANLKTQKVESNIFAGQYNTALENLS